MAVLTARTVRARRLRGSSRGANRHHIVITACNGGATDRPRSCGHRCDIATSNAAAMSQRSSTERADPRASARQAGLRYSTDSRPGISRRRAGRGFSYRDSRRTHDPRSIGGRAHPPAGDPAGVGGRLDLPRPSRAPPGNRARCARPQAVPLSPAAGARDATGTSSPGSSPSPRCCRGSGAAAIATSGVAALPRDKVLAAVVRLLELTLIRVGNDEYAKLNRSFGLTTLRDRHATVRGSIGPVPVPGQVRPAARGRRARSPAGDHRAPLPGPARAGALPVRRRRRRGPRRDLGRRQRLPARGGRGRCHGTATSGSGPAPSWRIGCCPRWSRPPDEPSARQNVLEAIRLSAGELGNTPAVARQAYVHPGVLEAYLDGAIAPSRRRRPGRRFPRPVGWLRRRPRRPP